jgi:outer membrane lipoprotein-sorting protein
MRLLCLMVVAVLLPGFGAVAQGPAVIDNDNCHAENILLDLENSYRDFGPLTFTFHQTTISSVFGEESSHQGMVWLDPCGRLRVETADETFLSRGDSLWHYVPAYNQLTIRVVDSGGRAGLPADFLWSLHRDFLPVDCARDTVGSRTFYRVRTVAKTATAAIQRLTVWVDPRRMLVERAEYVDYNDDRVNLLFTDVRKDADNVDLRYVLTVPDSVEVVTMPQKKRQQKATSPR